MAQTLSKPRLKQKYRKIKITPRFCYFRSENLENQSDFATEISYSLTRKNKFIHPKFFYDEKGSKLFEEICVLQEYYLTRTELEILRSIKLEMANHLSGDYALIELGSGSATKTRTLLEILTRKQKSVEYYPIDISEILKETSENLQRDYDNLNIMGIIDQYETGLKFIKKLSIQNQLIVFLGSSLGNFNLEENMKFLKKIRALMKENDLFLLGLDLVKDTKILEKAYNDSKGVTSKFNLNLLKRINDELAANFDLDKFEHVSLFNIEEKRIEMYLRSKEKHEVLISAINLALKLEKDELIHTEYSYKYTVSGIKDMAEKAGLKPVKIWRDKDNYFALVLFSIKN
ncbi:MAG: L-histidine N(alpha)-methyltransferase [Thaumarchaeota archaeon]|nr:MAG: L-histidine N(alpha)-methyltransferase [Nitrososphaerota archaeon]